MQHHRVRATRLPRDERSTTAQEQVLVCLKKLQQDLEFSDVATLTLYNGADVPRHLAGLGPLLRLQPSQRRPGATGLGRLSRIPRSP